MLCSYGMVFTTNLLTLLPRTRSLHTLASSSSSFNTLAKFPDIPRRTNEPQHTVKDNGVVGFIIASRNVEAKGMRIPDELLTKDIRGTATYKFYLVAKSAKEAEEKENMEKVKKAILAKEVETMVFDVDEVEFGNSLIASQEGPITIIEPKNHKESPNVESEEEDADYVDIA
ncbi:hypothetical protein Tco_0210448 [Tanacetum coccineum]